MDEQQRLAAFGAGDDVLDLTAIDWGEVRLDARQPQLLRSGCGILRSSQHVPKPAPRAPIRDLPGARHSVGATGGNGSGFRVLAAFAGRPDRHSRRGWNQGIDQLGVRLQMALTTVGDLPRRIQIAAH